MLWILRGFRGWIFGSSNLSHKADKTDETDRADKTDRAVLSGRAPVPARSLAGGRGGRGGQDLAWKLSSRGSASDRGISRVVGK